ncbi:hypothetical protein P692DRAFT_20661580, partial [Suillus brevipes Sb2]
LLPEDGLPAELLTIIKHSDQQHLLEQEREGYVIGDDDTEDDACLTDPSIVPMQSHGVVDAEATLLSDQEVLANAFTNTLNRQKESYTVKHGSEFVNEYPRLNAARERYAGTPEDPNHLLGAFP